MAKAIPIPIPLNGLNTISPDLPIEARYARELTNYSIVNGRLRMRPATNIAVNNLMGVGTARGKVLWHDIQNTSTNAYFILANGDVRTVSAPFTNITSFSSVSWSASVLQTKHISLDLITGVGTPRLSDYPFTAWTFTTIEITDTDITSACSHKGRLYVCDGTTIEYSNVGQVTGTMYDAFDVSEFMDGQTVLRIFSNTIGSGNQNADNVFVIFGNNGKVLVYQGDYPASSTWNLVADFDMPSPLTANSFCEIDGDIWVSSKVFAYWLSELFSNGVQGARRNAPTLPIENLWKATYTSESSPMDLETYYISELDAIVCSLNPSTIVNTTPYLSLVYFRKYNSWSYWKLPTFCGPVRRYEINGTTYYYGGTPPIGGGGGLTQSYYTLLQIKIDANKTRDDYILNNNTETSTDITTSWKTPFINAFKGNVQKVVGVRPYFLSSINGYLEKIRLIFDYSDYNTPFGFYDSATSPGNYADAQVDVPTTTWDNYSPFSSVSGAGGGVSLQITQQRKTGSADNQLNEIYSATIYVEDGGEMI